MQQKIYDYIESLEKRDIGKTSFFNKREEAQSRSPQEPPAVKTLKQ